MTDRRRINGPPGGTFPPTFSLPPSSSTPPRPHRTRQPDELRKIFLKCGITPSASGSAYFELASPPPPPSPTSPSLLLSRPASLKLACSVHGPHALPRSAPFSPNLVLSATVKFAPFANRVRRGGGRDGTEVERDLGVHLETALRGCVVGERWPKGGVEVVVVVLEEEGEGWWGEGMGVGGAESEEGRDGEGVGGWGMMGVLAGCVTVASAAMADAGIDCVDLVSGGVAAVVRERRGEGGAGMAYRGGDEDGVQLVLDPCAAEHQEVVAACVVAYLGQRDELTEVWMKGDAGTSAEALVDGAVDAAIAIRTVLTEAVREAAELRFPREEILDKPVRKKEAINTSQDVEMVIG